jgi:hypothetical protein
VFHGWRGPCSLASLVKMRLPPRLCWVCRVRLLTLLLLLAIGLGALASRPGTSRNVPSLSASPGKVIAAIDGLERRVDTAAYDAACR